MLQSIIQAAFRTWGGKPSVVIETMVIWVTFAQADRRGLPLLVGHCPRTQIEKHQPPTKGAPKFLPSKQIYTLQADCQIFSLGLRVD